MSFQLDRGLFQFEFTDRHAILGVSVNAEEADIRERYQAVARLLHPDSGKWKTDAEQQLAVQIFSRLVTHAYGTLFSCFSARGAYDHARTHGEKAA